MIGLWHTEGLWDMRMLVDMHSRGATALRASTAEHAKVLGPDAAAAPPAVATFQLGTSEVFCRALCAAAVTRVGENQR